MYVRAAAAMLALVALTGCAARRAGTTTDRTDLEAFIAKVRQLSLEARPARQPNAATIEATDKGLIAARLLLEQAPTAEHHRLVAASYVRLGVFDAAYDHFSAALRLDPRDSASLDGLARIWRDWGFPQRGLGDAYRAIGLAPNAPAPRNTLGTLLVGMGQPAAARVAFERALTLDPGASYALSNLCYTALLEGDASRAVDRCRAALDVDPNLKTARNNLALAYAAAGDFAAASREFGVSGGCRRRAIQHGGGAVCDSSLPGGGRGLRRSRGAAPVADAGAPARPASPGSGRGGNAMNDIATSTIERIRPMEPATLDASGLSFDLVIELVLKTLNRTAELSGTEIDHKIKAQARGIERRGLHRPDPFDR